MSRIKVIRAQLGLTQEELANRLRIDRPLLSKIENGQASLTEKQVEKLESLLKEQNGAEGEGRA